MAGRARPIPLMLTDAQEVRALAGQLGPPRDPVIAEWFGQFAATSSGVNVTADNARKCPEVDACVGLIEDTVATVPLDLFKRVSDDERVVMGDHPLHALLHDTPNSWQTSVEFRQMLEGWRSTHGNGYARIISGSQGPTALEPMHPSTIKPFRTSTGVAYAWTPPEGGARRILLQAEVLHLRGGPARPGNLAEAQGKVERHKEEIGLTQACGEYLSRFFSNNATPKAALEIPVGVSNEAALKLRENWESRHRGLDNAHRLAILDGGMKLTALGMNNNDAQIIETHAMCVKKIARIWGVPPHLIGDVDGSTSWGTGIEQQSIGFISYYMRPKFVAWEQALNMALMSSGMRKGFYFEFNIDALLRGDFKSRMEGYALLIQWGVMSINEIRKLQNLAPVEGGDERMFPLNMAPATRIMDVLLRDTAGKSQRDQLDLITRTISALAEANGVRALNGDHVNGN